jgi:hypothetical protein
MKIYKSDFSTAPIKSKPGQTRNKGLLGFRRGNATYNAKRLEVRLSRALREAWNNAKVT